MTSSHAHASADALVDTLGSHWFLSHLEILIAATPGIPPEDSEADTMVD